MKSEEVVLDEHIPCEEQIEPFDWEDHLYESWMEDKREEKRRRLADAGPSFSEMVKIGTRPIISIDGKPMLATHWDGYPASLGLDLLRCDKSVKAVIEVAKAHTIDAADPQLLETQNRERISQLAEKYQLLVVEIKAGKRRRNLICADDREIADISTYRDLAEFEYDIRNNAVFFRGLDGWWPESLKQAAEFERLGRSPLLLS